MKKRRDLRSHSYRPRGKRVSFKKLSQDILTIRDILSVKGPLTLKQLSEETGIPVETLRKGRLPYARMLGFVKKVGRKWDIESKEDLLVRRLTRLKVPIDKGTLRGVLKEFSMPLLAFIGYSANNEPACFARFEKVRGLGKCEACEAFLTLKDQEGKVITHNGVRYEHIPTIWATCLRVQDIGDYADLRLFRVGHPQGPVDIAVDVSPKTRSSQPKVYFCFSAASFEKNFNPIGRLAENALPIEKAVNPSIEIKISSKNAEIKPTILKENLFNILKACNINLESSAS